MTNTTPALLLPKDEPGFVNTRARLQRLQDMKIFHGWVEVLNLLEARILLRGYKSTIQIGDRFSVEVAGKDATAEFRGEAVSFQSQMVQLALFQQATLRQKVENVRIRMAGQTCIVKWEGNEYGATTVDISAKGLGILLQSRIEAGAEIEFELGTPIGSMFGTGKVVYCKFEPDSPGLFRVGIMVNDLDRLEQARWSKLLNPG